MIVIKVYIDKTMKMIRGARIITSNFDLHLYEPTTKPLKFGAVVHQTHSLLKSSGNSEHNQF